MVVGAALLLFLQVQMLELPNVEKNPYTSDADIALGKKLYGGRCAGCHGPTGDGGKGTNLAAPLLPRATTDLALYRIIRYGLPDTEMPRFNMAPREIWQVAAFVRTLGQIQREPVKGDPGRGAQLVQGKGGCLQCHAIGMQGGRLGPALNGIGSRRSPGHLRDKLLEPAKTVADQFRMVKLTTAAGKSISGVRLNEDTWSIQVRDTADRMHSFWKEELKEVRVDRTTPMPSYRGRLTPQEIEDVVAYLSGLRGSL